MNRLISLLLCATLGLAGCETTVDIAIPEHEPRLVVNGLFYADSLWTVEVSESVGVLSSEDLDAVTSATVEVLEGGEVVETLTGGRTSGLYRSDRHRPQPGRTYTVRVTAPGFPTAEATALIPKPVPITISSQRVTSGGGDYDRRPFELTLTFSDPASEPNYYALTVLQILDEESPDGRRRHVWAQTFSSADPVLRENRIDDEFFDPEAELYYERAYFSDASVDGRTVRLRIRTRFYNEPEVNDRFFVVLQSLSGGFYEYLRTRELAGYTNDNPLAEPVAVYTNVEGGLGIFAGSSASVTEIR